MSNEPAPWSYSKERARCFSVRHEDVAERRLGADHATGQDGRGHVLLVLGTSDKVDVHGVASPHSGMVDDHRLVVAASGDQVIGRLLGAGVVDAAQDLVVVQHQGVDTGVVGPADVDGVARSGGGRRCALNVQQTVAVCQLEAGPVDVDGGAAASDGDVVVGLHRQVVGRDAHRIGADVERLVDERSEAGDRNTQRTEAGAGGLLSLSARIGDVARHCAHGRFTLPERTDNGTDFSREATKNTLINFTHSRKDLESETKK